MPDCTLPGDHIEANPDRERFIRGVPALAVEIDLTSGKKPGGQQRIVDYLEAGAATGARSTCDSATSRISPSTSVSD